MKRLIPILLTVLSSCTCHNNWVQELENKNPLKDSADVISVYFCFDTIINDFEVSGILYPIYSPKTGWSEYENGARLFFHSRKTGKEYVWTDWSPKWRCHKNVFMSKNVYDIVMADDFKGFHNGDTYIFHYDTKPSIEPRSPIFPQAEYQFFDVDFDGEDELLLNYYRGGPKGCLASEIYDITDTALVLKYPKLLLTPKTEPSSKYMIVAYSIGLSIAIKLTIVPTCILSIAWIITSTPPKTPSSPTPFSSNETNEAYQICYDYFVGGLCTGSDCFLFG